MLKAISFILITGVLCTSFVFADSSSFTDAQGAIVSQAILFPVRADDCAPRLQVTLIDTGEATDKLDIETQLEVDSRKTTQFSQGTEIPKTSISLKQS